MVVYERWVERCILFSSVLFLPRLCSSGSGVFAISSFPTALQHLTLTLLLVNFFWLRLLSRFNLAQDNEFKPPPTFWQRQDTAETVRFNPLSKST